MNYKLKIVCPIILVLLVIIIGCKKTTYSLGNIKTPSGLVVTATVVGVDANNPNGDGSGNVVITANASNAITYKIDFGDGKNQIVSSGNITYKYTNPGTATYNITVNAIGTAGAISTATQKVTVYVAFVIPTNILQAITGGSSKVWITDKDAVGHVGVGPADGFTPSYYAAAPGTRSACQYDDEITFSQDANNNVSMTIDNKGQSFLIAASTSYYGFSGPDNCYNVDESGTKKLIFMNATSASTPANSTRIQFVVPGNGLINFGTGGNTYEILSLTATTMTLRNIGIDGNAWYQKLKMK